MRADYNCQICWGFKHFTPTEFKNTRKSKAINIPPLTGLEQ